MGDAKGALLRRKFVSREGAVCVRKLSGQSFSEEKGVGERRTASRIIRKPMKTEKRKEERKRSGSAIQRCA